jgi:hypothetical protein
MGHVSQEKLTLKDLEFVRHLRGRVARLRSACLFSKPGASFDRPSVAVCIRILRAQPDGRSLPSVVSVNLDYFAWPL